MIAVAWRVKDFADGWIYYSDDEAHARKVADEMGGALVEALYAAPASPAIGPSNRLAAIETEKTNPSLGLGDEADDLADAMGDLAALPDILKAEVRHHIREMYPRAAEAGGPSFILSVGNCVSNKAHARVMPALNILKALTPSGTAHDASSLGEGE